MERVNQSEDQTAYTDLMHAPVSGRHDILSRDGRTVNDAETWIEINGRAILTVFPTSSRLVHTPPPSKYTRKIARQSDGSAMHARESSSGSFAARRTSFCLYLDHDVRTDT